MTHSQMDLQDFIFGIMIKNDKTVVIPPVYKSLGKAFVEGVLIAETENSLYGLLNKEEKLSIVVD